MPFQRLRSKPNETDFVDIVDEEKLASEIEGYTRYCETPIIHGVKFAQNRPARQFMCL